ncbi:MAG: hypothetical protein HY233_02825 [Acidobacteriales bacterium]|nr:hypothetical protein [Terriglobales bacterium]
MNTTIARALAVVRILIGIGFVWMGISMLMNHGFLYGGLLEHLTATGGPVRIYRDIFLRVVEPRETLVVYFASTVSILLGLLYLTGTLISLTSLASSFLVVNYGLASSSWNRPRQLLFFLATVLLLMLGRMGAGCTWGVDGWLIRRFKDWLVLFPLRRKAPM